MCLGSTGWVHHCTLCAQAAGQRLSRGGGNTRTAEETGLAGEMCVIPSAGKSDSWEPGIWSSHSSLKGSQDFFPSFYESHTPFLRAVECSHMI